MLDGPNRPGNGRSEGPAQSSRKSLANRNWIDPVAEYGEKSLVSLCGNLDISLPLGRILAARNLLDDNLAYNFLNPRLEDMHSPFLLRDMLKAINRIREAVEGHEKILVFGDYDMDGTASATMLFSYLKSLGARAIYYIPHRLNDGYGITAATVEKIRGWRVNLVITTDHGATDMEAPPMLAAHGIDIIVTDHHQMGGEKPAAHSLVNPQQKDCQYPFKDLSAAGVVYKLICALDDHLSEHQFFERNGLRRTPPDYYLDLVAMATVADMVPLLGENRILVKQGLERLNTRPRPGLSGLIKECRIKGPITPRVISFRMAPKINALGRIGDPKGAMQLLLSRSYSESRMLARELLEANRARQEIEQVALEGAQEQSAAMAHSHALILQGTDWHPGVIGTIATRISTETGKPTIVLTAQDSEYFMGSARSSNNVNILKMLDACAHLLERHGGHPNAAGLVIHKSRFEEFSRLFLSATKACGKLHCPPENLNIEAWLGQESLTPGFFQEVSRLSPFGYCNPEPMVGMKGVLLGEADLINKRHLRFSLDASGGNRLEAFVRDCPDWELDTNSRYDLAFMPQIYHSPRGPRSQLKVVDIKTCEG